MISLEAARFSPVHPCAGLMHSSPSNSYVVDRDLPLTPSGGTGRGKMSCSDDVDVVLYGLVGGFVEEL